jgi:hypothetical protein
MANAAMPQCRNQRIAQSLNVQSPDESLNRQLAIGNGRRRRR